MTALQLHAGVRRVSWPASFWTLQVVVPEAPLEKTFISAESLLRDSLQLGLRIVRSDFRPSFLVGVWRGGAPIGISVQEVLEYNGIECDHIAIRTSSYSGIDQQARAVRVHAIDYLVSQLTFEDRLLLIDDVFDSGRSLEAVLDELARRCRRNLPEHIRIATVYYKPARNRSRIQPDYYIRETDQWLVFPHELQGLTREEILAHKPVGEDFFER
jgi:hypoxanthine phosphoribosyltransferase